MQQFVRTVNTTEAFKLKLEHLEREYKIRLQSIKEEISLKEAELSKYSLVGVGGQLGGGLLKFIAWLVMIVGVLLLVVAVGVAIEKEPFAIMLFAFAIVAIMFAAAMFAKSSAIRREAEEKQEEVQQISEDIEMELEQLRKELRTMEHYYHDEMIKQKLVYEQHMLNQQDLIEQEVSVLRQSGPNTATVADDSKECPQCAEMVKARAKICRFCNYNF